MSGKPTGTSKGTINPRICQLCPQRWLKTNWCQYKKAKLLLMAHEPTTTRCSSCSTLPVNFSKKTNFLLSEPFQLLLSRRAAEPAGLPLINNKRLCHLRPLAPPLAPLCTTRPLLSVCVKNRWLQKVFKRHQHHRDSREMTGRRAGGGHLPPPTPHLKHPTRQHEQGPSASPHCRGQNRRERAQTAVSHTRGQDKMHAHERGSGQIA